jgi:hypothetical protein
MHGRHDQQEETLIINIALTRGLMALLSVALLAAAVVAHVAWGESPAAAAGPPAAGAASSDVRQYYLTKGTYSGAGANLRCAAGYHMASLWEILDPSNLQYNTTLGQTRDDSGEGPTTFRGWVRTGYTSSIENTAGRANCEAWTNGVSGYGTTAALPNTWNAGWQDLHVWNVQTYACNDVNRVWCVED